MIPRSPQRLDLITCRAVLFCLLISSAFGQEVPSAKESVDRPVTLNDAAPWVEVVTWELPTAKPVAGAAAEIILSDQQSHLTPEGSDYFQHTVVRLANAQGVRQNSEWAVVYAPDHEQLTWHKLRVTRNGEAVDRLPNARFKTLQRETGFETQIYNGQATVVTILEDIRVGDIVEVAYTLRSANPVLRGQMTARHHLGSSYPIKRQRIVVHTPASEPEPFHSFVLPPGTRNLPPALYSPASLRLAVEKEESAGLRTLRWEGKTLPAIQFDSGVSGQAAPFYPLLQVSSFKAWSAVAEWGEALFAGSADMPESARTMVDQWMRVHATPEELLNAAVRWVQDDVRYFAMAVGDYNLRPRPLAEVCASRYGDCKDKALLLSVMLRALGFEAWPALVNTYLRERIAELPPAPQAFDHAIVAYRWKGNLHFIDATIKGQQGAPGSWALPPYRSALILRKGELGLTAIPGADPNEPDSETTDTFTVDANSGDAQLRVTTVLRGLQADYYRQYLETSLPTEIGDRWFNFISRFYKRLEEVGPPIVNDDHGSNRITLHMEYRLPGFMRISGEPRSVGLYAYSLRALLDPPESRRRRWPQALAGGRFVRHRLEIELPFSSPPDQLPEVIAAEGMDFRTEKGLAGRRFVAVHDLRLTRDYVDAARMDQFCDAVDDVMNALATTIQSVGPIAATTAVLPSPAVP